MCLRDGILKVNAALPRVRLPRQSVICLRRLVELAADSIQVKADLGLWLFFLIRRHD